MKLSILVVSTLILGGAAAADPLHFAARDGDIDLVARLIEEGAVVDSDTVGNASPNDDVTPLFLAAQNGYLDIVLLLLAAGADPEYNKRLGEVYAVTAPIHVAARFGHLEIVEAFLDAGANPNLNDNYQGNVLHAAKLAGHEDVAELLIARGARLSTPSAPVDHLLENARPNIGRRLAAGACGSCHALTAEGPLFTELGPTLWNIVNRPKASIEGYQYTEAMRQLGGVWTYADLSSIIGSPYEFIPGTRHRKMGIEDLQLRADLISYLRELSVNPAKLP